MAELIFTVHKESVFTLLDFFERRTGRLFFNISSIDKLIDPISEYLTQVFSWDDTRLHKEQKELKRAVDLASKFE
jgi:glycerol-3-phosphate dehydrogenase